jgi:hypothetical protein
MYKTEYYLSKRTGMGHPDDVHAMTGEGVHKYTYQTEPEEVTPTMAAINERIYNAAQKKFKLWERINNAGSDTT